MSSTDDNGTTISAPASEQQSVNGVAHDQASHSSETAIELDLPQPELDDQRTSTASSDTTTHSLRYSAGNNMATPMQQQEIRQNNNEDAATTQFLPALQLNGDTPQYDLATGDDPRSFDLIAPKSDKDDDTPSQFALERASQSLFSKDHLQIIFADPTFLMRFTTFLSQHRPSTSVSLLVHYLDSLKSLRAVHYANAICEGLDPVPGLDFTASPVKPTVNQALEERAERAFDMLVQEELPAFVCETYIAVVTKSITARITGSLSPQLREASEGLAEVFCLTDPSRKDNPIIFASEGVMFLWPA